MNLSYEYDEAHAFHAPAAPGFSRFSPSSPLAAMVHTAAITAVYKNSSSRTVEYTFSVGQGGVSDIVIDSVTDNPAVAYDIYGRTVDLATARGIIIVRRGGKFQKILRK